MGPNLIFMAGLTGSGKSGLKKVLLDEFENIDKEIKVSVDDIFENDKESIAIFHKLYSFHFGESCNNINKLSEEIRITRYLSRLFGMESFRTITSKCVLNQIHRRYCPGKKKTIPFSQFASAIYFALRERRLDHEYDESIKNYVKGKENENENENEDVIIETNGENVNGIITWYMEGKKQPYQICPEYDATLPCKSKQKPIDLKTELKKKKYNITVCFLKRDVCPTINSLQERALKDVCNFISEPKAPVPRLPEIDNDSLQRKMKGINETYTTLKNSKNEYGQIVVRVFYNPEQNKDTNGIIELTDANIPETIYPDLEISCSRGGRKTKRRKTKRRKTKCRRKTKARRR